MQPHSRPSALLYFLSLRGAPWLQEWGLEWPREAGAVVRPECAWRRPGQDMTDSREHRGCFLPSPRPSSLPWDSRFGHFSGPWGRSRPGVFPLEGRGRGVLAAPPPAGPSPLPAKPSAKLLWPPPPCRWKEGSWGGGGGLWPLPHLLSPHPRGVAGITANRSGEAAGTRGDHKGALGAALQATESSRPDAGLAQGQGTSRLPARAPSIPRSAVHTEIKGYLQGSVTLLPSRGGVEEPARRAHLYLGCRLPVLSRSLRGGPVVPISASLTGTGRWLPLGRSGSGFPGCWIHTHETPKAMPGSRSPFLIYTKQSCRRFRTRGAGLTFPRPVAAPRRQASEPLCSMLPLNRVPPHLLSLWLPLLSGTRKMAEASTAGAVPSPHHIAGPGESGCLAGKRRPPCGPGWGASGILPWSGCPPGDSVRPSAWCRRGLGALGPLLPAP